MTFLQEMDAGAGFVIHDLKRDKGSELSPKYHAAQPFPHIVIDDFLPAAALESCLEHFPVRKGGDTVFDRDQERYKAQYNPDSLSPHLRGLFYSFNSRPFIRVLENITGIDGLIPDPYFLGGGFHEISQGGHLSIHADFNHHKPMNLERRINVLIYLNKAWTADHGGQLELWNDAMTTCMVSVVPLFNRCVIFNTTSNSNHGNPNPINHPEKQPRRSIALYYYTATWDGANRDHTTQFRARPASTDKIDWQVKTAELADDFFPPIIVRNFRRAKRRLIGS
jgi:Rps23 Pro-64 3,4-dihydroxylase Tpa1-like proline 4-hydroxylase